MRGRLTYSPPLDGVRAAAVLIVIVGHASYGRIPGPAIGVEVFFVLSGFLITTLLLQERHVTGRVSLAQFYERRVRRLLPALVACLLLTWVLALADPDSAHARHLGWGTLGALFYANNWLEATGVLDHISYLTHTWSLAVEEQFYLVWPITLLILLRARNGGSRLRLVTAGLAILALSWRFAIFAVYDPGDRITYGSDTRAFGILLGCLLALLLDSERGAKVVRRIATPVAVPVVAGAVVAFLALTRSDLTLVDVGFGLTLTDVAAAVLIAHVLVRAESLATRVLGHAIPVWIGQRSYGLYLYHFPVQLYISGKAADRLYVGPIPQLVQEPVRVLVPFALAALSYRFLEQPFRGHGRRPVTAPQPAPELVSASRAQG